MKASSDVVHGPPRVTQMLYHSGNPKDLESPSRKRGQSPAAIFIIRNAANFFLLFDPEFGGWVCLL